jgi:hypothetical protein
MPTAFEIAGVILALACIVSAVWIAIKKPEAPMDHERPDRW